MEEPDAHAHACLLISLFMKFLAHFLTHDEDEDETFLCACMFILLHYEEENKMPIIHTLSCAFVRKKVICQ